MKNGNYKTHIDYKSYEYAKKLDVELVDTTFTYCNIRNNLTYFEVFT